MCVTVFFRGAAIQNNTSNQGSQVAGAKYSGTAVHDLFHDMYNDPMSRSLPDYQTGRHPFKPNQPANNYQQKPLTVNTQAMTHGYTQPTQSDLYNNFHDAYKPYNTNSTDIYSDYNQGGGGGQSMVYRNYKPDASLNTSTDSGVSLGQDSSSSYMQRQNSNLSSHSFNNSDPCSAAASETSDPPYFGSYSIQSPNQNTAPSPPLPPPPPPTQFGSPLKAAALNNNTQSPLSPVSRNNLSFNGFPSGVVPPPPPPLPSASKSSLGGISPASKTWQSKKQETSASQREDPNEVKYT